MNRAAAVVLLATTVLAVGCADGRPPAGSGDRRNVVLVVIDTARADKFGCYGSDLGATPRIDRLAAEGAVFERAYSHASWTLPAAASLFTSLYPPQHGAGGSVHGFTGLSPSAPTLAATFRASGYATAAIVNVDFLGHSFGMTNGFEHVDFEAYPGNLEVRPAGVTTDAALDWLRSRDDRPFLLLVHYFDPHLVYAPPARFRSEFASPSDRDNESWVFGTREDVVKHRLGRVAFDENIIRRAEKLYDGEVAFTDHEVGRLLDGLADLGLAETTVVAVTADHGEEFWDHGGFEHGHSLHGELVHVPLVIRAPGTAAPTRVPATVGHVDVAPTLCELAGIEADPMFSGRSLAGLMAGRSEPDRPVVFEGNFWGDSHTAWLQGGYKLIRLPDGSTRLYDLAADPGEQVDVGAADPDRVSRMVRDLDLALKSMSTKGQGIDTAVELSEEEIRRLEALGYIQSDPDD